MRTLGTTLAAVLTAASLLATPTHAATGPRPLDHHDSALPPTATDLSSGPHGTVYVSGGRAYLVAAPMTPASPRTDLGPRATPRTDAAAPVVRGRRVVVPRSAPGGSTVTAVGHCDVAECPAMTTFAVPAGFRYAGATEDAAILYRSSDHAYALAPWTGDVFATAAVPAALTAVDVASGDATGVVLHGANDKAAYVRRADGAVTATFDADEVELSPGYATFHVSNESAGVTAVRSLARDADSADWTTLVDAPYGEIDEFAAGDTGAAWLVDLTMDEIPPTSYLLSVARAGGLAPAGYPREVDTGALAAFEGSGSFLVNDLEAGVPGLYAVAAGSSDATAVGALPPRRATNDWVSLSHGRAAYVSDVTHDSPVLRKDVVDGVPVDGSERMVAPRATLSASMSGPYLAYNRDSVVTYGRIGGHQASLALPSADRRHVQASGRRFVVSGGAHAWLVDGAERVDLGRAVAYLFGDYVVTLRLDTGAIVRRDLANGETAVVRPAIAGCVTGASCVNPFDHAIAVWGHEVVYTFADDKNHVRVSGRWNGNLGVTSALPDLGTATARTYRALAYWAGLLVVLRTDDTVVLHDLYGADPTAATLVDGDAAAPVAIDGVNVAWRRRSDGRAYVRSLAELVGDRAAPPRYLGGTVPAGYAPGGPVWATWAPSFLLSQDAGWTLTIRDAQDAVVRELSGVTTDGEAAPAWDGTTTAGADVPQGSYTWTLTGAGLSGGAVKTTSGLHDVTGSVYVSRVAPAAPALTTPVRSTDESAGPFITARWTPGAGTPPGTTFVLQQSYNGRTWHDIRRTTATSQLVDFGFPGTYRYRVRAVDPAGRTSPWSNVSTTLRPYDDTSGGSTGTWTRVKGASFYEGSQRRASTAGYRYWITAYGKEIQLIGAKGPNYGRFSVSIDGGPWSAPIDAYRSSTRYRSVLYTKSGLAAGMHKIEVRVAGTPGRPYVGIDAVAYRR